MPARILLPDFITRQSPRALIMFAVPVVLTLAVVLGILQIRPIAKSRIELMLHDAGFKTVTVGKVSIGPSGLHASDIQLDSYGFDSIKALDARLNWLSFLAGGKLSELQIKGMSISRDSDNFTSGGKQLIDDLLHLPEYRVAISDVTLDLATDFGAIRLKLDATTTPSQDGHDIKANINADQYQLGFTSAWQGTLKKDGQLDLGGNIVDGRLFAGPLRVSRFNGWLGMTMSKDGYSMQSQLEAGSATFMKVPLEAVSVVNDMNAAQDSIIVRSGISGMNDVLFTADMNKTENAQEFTAILKGGNLGGLLDYIDEVTKSNKKISDTLLNMRDFQLVGRFQPEKQFVGGPMPFGITLQSDKKQILDGNVLFYPDTLDVRGSLETDPAMALALQDYFKIPSESIKQNFIRLDGDVKRFFDFEGPSSGVKPQQ